MGSGSSAVTAPDESTFVGFGPRVGEFLAGLAADNSKQYFDAHRSVYDSDVAGPLKRFVVAVGDALAASAAPDLEYEPKVGRSMFRINRDLRFGNDPTPYHTHLDVIWWRGPHPRTSPAFICRITPDLVRLGGGVAGLKGASLDAYRRAVDRTGDELDDVVGGLRRDLGSGPDSDVAGSAVGLEVSEPSRARVPKPYAGDHPHADWLRRDGFHVSGTWTVPPSITSAEFAPWSAARLEMFAPVVQWLVSATESDA